MEDGPLSHVTLMNPLQRQADSAQSHCSAELAAEVRTPDDFCPPPLPREDEIVGWKSPRDARLRIAAMQPTRQEQRLCSCS